MKTERKGKTTFTTSASNEIKKLISKKVVATHEEQKKIRAKIRKLCFYYSDFSSSKRGYTVQDFDNLIKEGRIKIIK